MKHGQQGFGLVFLIVSLAVLAIMAALYFTQNGSNSSQYELSQDAIQRAKEINQNKLDESKAIQRQNELRNVLEQN